MTDASSVNAPLRRNAGLAVATLVASAGTLVCCVLPAVMVSLGAGAALAGLVSAVPQLVWLSEHKPGVFGLAFGLLAVSGVLLWRARSLPCPADPNLARTCARLRRVSVVLWSVALAATAAGAMFAFVLPYV
jgi:hypothetical protein